MENIEDLKMLREMRRKPLKFSRLDSRLTIELQEKIDGVYQKEIQVV